MTLNHALAETEHWLGLAPLLTLCILHAREQERDRGYWLLATAFAVSWVADSAAHWADPLVVSVSYLGAQAGLIGMVLLTRWQAAAYIVLLTITGFVALSIQPTAKRDVLQHTIAWLGICAIAFNRWEVAQVRTALLVGFFPMWIAWLWYVAAWPSFPAGYTVQAARMIGIFGYSGAVWRSGRWLRLDRT